MQIECKHQDPLSQVTALGMGLRSIPPVVTLLSCSSHPQSLVLIAPTYRENSPISSQLCPTSKEDGDARGRTLSSVQTQVTMAEREERGRYRLQGQPKPGGGSLILDFL